MMMMAKRKREIGARCLLQFSEWKRVTRIETQFSCKTFFFFFLSFICIDDDEEPMMMWMMMMMMMMMMTTTKYPSTNVTSILYNTHITYLTLDDDGAIWTDDDDDDHHQQQHHHHHDECIRIFHFNFYFFPCWTLCGRMSVFKKKREWKLMFICIACVCVWLRFKKNRMKKKSRSSSFTI